MPPNSTQSFTSANGCSYYFKRLPTWLIRWCNSRILKLLCTIYYQIRRPFILPYLEVCITPRCSLHCAECANLMPFYNDARDYSTDNIINDTMAILDAVDGVLMLRVLGGEPLLHKDVGQIVGQIASSSKVCEIQIVTNGTILPSNKTLKALQHRKVSVDISNYGAISKNMHRLFTLLKVMDIPYRYTEDFLWNKMGVPVLRNYTGDFLQSVYAGCREMCKTIVDGELHVCPRSAHAKALKLVTPPTGEYINIRTTKKEELALKIKGLYELESLEACRLCLPTSDRVYIPVAVQLRKRSIISSGEGW